jgi:predicted alpha/beta hydrolase family esterase
MDHVGTVAAGMGRPSYLILHGYQGSGPGHWQTWLAGRLRAADAQVAYPDLPDADQPQLRSWLGALAGELDALGEPPVVLCHSLACLLWLHHAAGGGAHASRVLMVAPPTPHSELDALQSFLPPPLDADALRTSAPEGVRLVCSDNDPYCPEGADVAYASLRIPTDVIPGRGHLNPEAGLGPWPEVEAWAREGAVPVTATGPAQAL